MNRLLNDDNLDYLKDLTEQIVALNPELGRVEYNQDDSADLSKVISCVLLSFPVKDIDVCLSLTDIENGWDDILSTSSKYVDAQIRQRFYQERLQCSIDWVPSAQTLKHIKSQFNETAQWRLSQKTRQRIHGSMCHEAFDQARQDFEAIEKRWHEIKDSAPLQIFPLREPLTCP